MQLYISIYNEYKILCLLCCLLFGHWLVNHPMDNRINLYQRARVHVQTLVLRGAQTYAQYAQKWKEPGTRKKTDEADELKSKMEAEWKRTFRQQIEEQQQSLEAPDVLDQLVEKAIVGAQRISIQIGETIWKCMVLPSGRAGNTQRRNSSRSRCRGRLTLSLLFLNI